jgi:hypothetical protein
MDWMAAIEVVPVGSAGVFRAYVAGSSVYSNALFRISWRRLILFRDGAGPGYGSTPFRRGAKRAWNAALVLR